MSASSVGTCGRIAPFTRPTTTPSCCNRNSRSCIQPLRSRARPAEPHVAGTERAHAQRCADEDERLRRLAVLLRARRVAQHARECAHCCGVVKLRVGEIRLSRRFVRRLAVVTTSRGGSSCGAHPGLRDRIQCPEHAERAKQVRARLRLPLRSQQREQRRQQLGILCIRSRRVAGGAHELRKYRQRRATSRVRGLIPQRINDRREEERRQLAHRFPPDEDETAERRQHTRGDRGGRVGGAGGELGVPRWRAAGSAPARPR